MRVGRRTVPIKRNIKIPSLHGPTIVFHFIFFLSSSTSSHCPAPPAPACAHPPPASPPPAPSALPPDPVVAIPSRRSASHHRPNRSPPPPPPIPICACPHPPQPDLLWPLAGGGRGPTVCSNLRTASSTHGRNRRLRWLGRALHGRNLAGLRRDRWLKGAPGAEISARQVLLHDYRLRSVRRPKLIILNFARGTNSAHNFLLFCNIYNH
jgi:hypothetical protein